MQLDVIQAKGGGNLIDVLRVPVNKHTDGLEPAFRRLGNRSGFPPIHKA